MGSCGRDGLYEDENQMCMLDEIAAKRDKIHAIAKGHKAEELWVVVCCVREEAHTA
jgi:hypothetical protein